MDFRAAARRTGSNLSEEDSMDPVNMGGEAAGNESDWQPGVETDGRDPAAPGGPSPFNGAEPQESQPVTSDPMWSDPTKPNMQGTDMPHIRGPNEEAQTLHNARRARYAAKERVRQE